MGMWNRFTSLLLTRSSDAAPLEPRLSARNESELSASIRELQPGARGWITHKKAGSLFSLMGNEYAFGKLDEQGRAKLGAFAAQDQLRCEFTLTHAEKRVYSLDKQVMQGRDIIAG
jgi:hypothetical protein